MKKANVPVRKTDKTYFEEQAEIIVARNRRKRKNLLNNLKHIIWMIFLIILMVMVWNKQEVNAYDGDKLLNYMNLESCRVVQNQDSHITKAGGSIYAYDIACIRGKTFNVYAPNYKDIYVIKYIGYDKRIGNYVTIKHGNLYFVYGHTKTDLKIGTALKPGQFIGKTDVSGLSQNYHLHLELWEGGENINFNYLEGKGSIKNDKSYALKKQRNWLSGVEVNTEILEFIKQFEGVRLNAYFDIKHYSIGFGTPSYKGEIITIHEAEKRARIRIQNIKDKYNLHHHPVNVQKAVVSFIYNVGSLTIYQQWKLNNYYYTALGNDFKQYNGYYKDGKKIVLKGLIKRRNAECELF